MEVERLEIGFSVNVDGLPRMRQWPLTTKQSICEWLNTVGKLYSYEWHWITDLYTATYIVETAKVKLKRYFWERWWNRKSSFCANGFNQIPGIRKAFARILYFETMRYRTGNTVDFRQLEVRGRREKFKFIKNVKDYLTLISS